MKSPRAPIPCHCGSSGTYEKCCGRFIDGYTSPTAEALMRSRYCAYVLERRDYLLATWHSRTRPAELALESPAPRWLGLDVRAASLQDPDHATVEFVARLRIGGRGVRMHEVSRFVREDERWFYVDGDMRN